MSKKKKRKFVELKQSGLTQHYKLKVEAKNDMKISYHKVSTNTKRSSSRDSLDGDALWAKRTGN